MKLQKILLATALVVLSASCQNQIENPVDKSDASDVKLIPVTFNAQTEETKTTLDGLSIVWEEGDQINVIDNSILCEDYSAFDATSAGSATGFSGLIGEDATVFYALYPYDAATQATCSAEDDLAMFTTTLKTDQYARPSGLPANTNLAFAKADDQKAFTFHNLCAVVKFTLTRSDIATIEIAPNGEEALAFAGAINVTVDTDGAKIERSSTTTTKSLSIEPATGDTFVPGIYYVCALPGSYDGGITVTFMNTETARAEISSDAALTLTQGKIRNLGTIDKNLDFGGGDTPSDKYVKVTSASDLTDGQYLIVCEDQNLAFNGALKTLDAVGNSIAISIANGEIASSAEINNAAFTFTASDGSFLGKGGKYFGNASNSNALTSSDEALTNTVSITTDGNADIVSAGGAYLRYNATSGQTRFRYYKSSTYTAQKAIQLYKKNGTPVPPATKYTITVPDNITGGTLTPSKTEAEAGETVTITANPAAGYKLSTLTANVNGESIEDNILTFIMPEANVTISASFEEIPSVDCSGEYIIIGTDGEHGYFAMNQYVDGNNCKGKSVSYTNGSVSGNNLGTCKVTLSPVEGKDGYYTILDSGGKFLYAASTSSNYLKGNDTATAAAAHWYVQCIDNEWAVIADNTGKDNLHNVMRYNYNSGSPIFACYASATQNAVILVKWDKVEDIAVEPVDATWSVTPESVSVYEGETAKVTITTNYDGTLQVESGSTDTATATISGKTITVNGVAAGTTTLTIRGSATVNYKEIEESISVTVSEKPTTSAITITSNDVVSASGYTTYSNDDWIITFGGNNMSVGTNSGNRSKCKLGENSKYAVSPITTTGIASAFASLKSLANVSKVTYTYNGGSNQTNTNVYLLYSSDGNTFSQVSLKKGTQGASISSETVFEFDKCSGYFAVVFVATNTSGNWRIDNVELTFE